MRHHTTSIVGPDIDDSNHPETPDSCPDPYPSDLLAAIPWAKEARLELVEVKDTEGYGPWLFITRDHWYCPRGRGDWFEFGTHIPPKTRGMFGYYKTRAAALKSPPPKPPGFEQPPAQPSVGENVMRAIHVASGWSGVELTQSLRDTLRPMALAVRREVLAEPFTDEDVKAADKAFMAFRGGGRTDWIRAALSAALASRVKRAEREGKQ